jgi:hypothetical protein
VTDVTSTAVTIQVAAISASLVCQATTNAFTVFWKVVHSTP